jgi:hypothetical protein
MKRRPADDALESRPPDVIAVPHQSTGERDADVVDAESVDAESVDAECLEAQAVQEESAPPVLDERQLQMLDFERLWWRHAGSKEQAIRDTFALSPTRYYQLLNALLDEPAALAHDPTTVNRLRRLRATRTRRRRTPS